VQVGVGLRFVFYQSKKGKGKNDKKEKIKGVAMTIPASWQKLFFFDKFILAKTNISKRPIRAPNGSSIPNRPLLPHGKL
jgi:hypothetical protein